ncbi:SPOR domain-containing protein [Pseudomonas matsuisoli]|uniref:SPOR domain-containing protein n=1 Tax=Pseudomonas matsuisoli TaxID=1515666 RepID=A0A917PIJ1_9PSED|nr:SPOR domain-containing protein [Pseudomonas matsuisoli]GGJ79981.1 hypothetical protein GCM10009304_02120 [Pseudomonas matsuisoli]
MQKGLKQRIVGALVLLALAVIFLPMLFTRQDDMRHAVVEAPPAPQTPAMPEISMESVETPEPAATPDSMQDQEGGDAAPTSPTTPPPSVQPLQQPEVPPLAAPEDEQVVAAPSAPPPTPAPTAPPKEPIKGTTDTQAAAPDAQKAPASRLDTNDLPVSWSIQLASLSNRASAENLQKTLRSDGYNAYIRTVGGMNRVFVGPVIERAEADKLRAQLNRQRKLDGFVVRFQPEQG